MKLSVIIVNYNVKYFLEQCLHSVIAASKNISTEIIVIDNNSVDGSVAMVRNKFPAVTVIANAENTGFSKANNQGIAISKGEYVLLLNPDTVVEEDTFTKVTSFMDAHPEAGGLGVRMLNGAGKFLPESKRGLPTPEVAFYKIFGLSALFPKSKVFGRYHLGFLNEHEINEVDILAGAFMLLRKSTLEKTGLLDEAFFMYGEDIDLSYRIIKAGFKNYYYPDTRIIHYKGESTKRSSVNYVFVFYNAMIIFARKHFSKSNASLFTFFIRIAIYLRATTALFARLVRRALLPALDFALIFTGILMMKNYWSANYGIRYPEMYLQFVVPCYCLIWVLTIFFSGGYDLPVNTRRIVRGVFSGTVLILIAYALLPEQLRFSRALILLGAFWASASIVVSRLIINLFSKRFVLSGDFRKRLMIVGSEEEGNRILSLLKISETSHNFIGFVKPGNDVASHRSTDEYEKYYLGDSSRLREMTEVYRIDEIIFCGKDLTSQEIISHMSLTSSMKVEYKIAPPESLFIIGSSNVEDPGELYIIDINSINTAVNKRNKRLIDIAVSLFLLLLSPVMILFQRSSLRFLKNLIAVLSGKISWVGYSGRNDMLPKIREGVLTPLDGLNTEVRDQVTINRLNALYAKDYRVYTDLNIIRKAWKNLGRSTIQAA